MRLLSEFLNKQVKIDKLNLKIVMGPFIWVLICWLNLIQFSSLFICSTISFATSTQTCFCKKFNDFIIYFAVTRRKPKISLKIVFTKSPDLPKCFTSSLTFKCRFPITFFGLFHISFDVFVECVRNDIHLQQIRYFL